jgi:hypothetical protein
VVLSVKLNDSAACAHIDVISGGGFARQNRMSAWRRHSVVLPLALAQQGLLLRSQAAECTCLMSRQCNAMLICGSAMM